MTIEINPFQARFEDIIIHAHKAQFQLMYEAVEIDTNSDDRLPGTSGVYNFGITTYAQEGKKEVVGDLQIVFRNQGDDFNLCLFLILSFSAHSKVDENGKSIFCKLIQYLFDWTSIYIRENDIKDSDGKYFIMPPFHYSKDSFWNVPE